MRQNKISVNMGGRVFPRPFTHGGQVQGDKLLMGGGTHEGGHRPYTLGDN